MLSGRRGFALVLPLVVGSLVGCDGAPSAASPSVAPATSSPARPDADAGAVQPQHAASDALRRCAEVAGTPASIEDTMARLGALPAPADGPCFVATLPRPLAVVATRGVTSAQPAAGPSSPRLFFLLPKLVISAVPEGDGSKVLELGEWVTPSRTLKGEIDLPITTPPAADAAFRRVLQDNGSTICATCHREEEQHASIANGYVSAAYKPEPGTYVTLAALSSLHDACTRDDDPSARCAMLHAVFDFGAVTQGDFGPDVGTFFSP
ncbi:MAG: hypothetical protein KIT84_09235 [Labilithrix sp.]|nr:hypothetical protein [Labilithrix sp.]MCW5811183.1 hypothetical protein [Labilithrix sp.]